MFVSRRFVLLCVFATLALCAPANSIAQPLLNGPALPGGRTEAGATPAPLTDKRTQNAEQLRLAQRKLDSNGSSDKAAAQELAYYQTREAVLAQQTSVEQQIKDLNARKTKLENQLKSPPAVEKACTFTELDRMKDDLAAEQARAVLLADKLATAKASVVRAQSALDEAEVKRRQAQAAYESGKEGTHAAELAAAAERTRHDAELAGETLELRKNEVAREQLAQEVQKLSEQVRKELVARMSPQVVFKEADYQDQIDEIKKSQDSATNALSQAQASLRNIEFERAKTQKQLEDAAGADRLLLTEKLEAQNCTRLRLNEEIDSLSQRLQQLSELQIAWHRRYEIATSDKSNDDRDVYLQRKAQQKKTKAEISELASGLRIQILKMRELRSSLASVAKKADAAAKGPVDVLSWIQEQRSQLEDTLRLYDQKLVTIETSRRVHEKLLEEISANLQSLTPASIALSAWYKFQEAWNYSFMRVNKEPITVGMAIKGLATLVLGWMLARFVSAMVAYRVLKRFRLSKDATSAIRSLVFYSVLAGVCLEAMHMVNVDLTAFTILGGALAIGVGFGSQALINNFIGGLIMLAERPVRLGERITFDGTDGIVEDVGFRCTKLRTNSDHLLTIPNSTLVNQSIENIDRRRTIRRKMNIPVTYNLSRETLGAAVQAIRDVLEEREIRERIHPIIGFEEYLPRVFFSEFASESLTIQVVYWYAPADWWSYMEHSERVNFRIMEEFARLGIDFAFPSKTSFVKNSKKPPTGREPGSFAA